jgi:two-component system nitrate/nitrite response regulator NarL
VLTSDPIRVLVAASDNLTRAGLAALISGLPGLLVCGQTDDNTLLADIDLYEPDVIVWDVSQVSELLTGVHDLNVPVVAIVSDNTSAVTAWSNGIRGILARDVKSAKLAAAIKAVAERLSAVDARFTDAPASSSSYVPPTQMETLTERELEVLQLVAEGLPNKSIAAKLGISEHTIKFHVNSILSKTGAQSRTQAVTLATRFGLIKL